MNRLPQRLSLVAQTAAVLKDGIKAGRWNKQLPGENGLCTLLHVGRDTLRSALSRLQRDGWVRTSQGRRREIVIRGRRKIRSVSDRVVLLTPRRLENLPPNTLFWIDGLREHLAEENYHLEVHEHPACYTGRPERALESLAARLNPAGWVLSQSTARMQQWFSARSVPCVITGSRHDGVILPCVDRDYRAISRHAVGALLARGHTRLALVSPGPDLAGDLECEEGFKEGLQKSRGPCPEFFISRHTGTVADITAKLDLLLKRNQITGLLVSKSQNVLTVISHLLLQGRQIPKEVALVSRDDDSFLEDMLPSVARYSLSPSLFARKVSSLVVELVQGGTVHPHKHLLMPRFVPGQTLGPPA